MDQLEPGEVVRDRRNPHQYAVVAPPTVYVPPNITQPDPDNCTAVKNHQRYNATIPHGWVRIDRIKLPFVMRGQISYISVRLIEGKLLARYPSNYPELLRTRAPLKSFYMTTDEAKRLNDFTLAEFSFTDKDLIVALEDFQDFYSLLKLAFPIGIPSLTGGWLQVNNSVVPYVNRLSVKMLPLCVLKFASQVSITDRIKGEDPSIEEYMYLNSISIKAGMKITFDRNTLLVSETTLTTEAAGAVVKDLPSENPFEKAVYCGADDMVKTEEDERKSEEEERRNEETRRRQLLMEEERRLEEIKIEREGMRRKEELRVEEERRLEQLRIEEERRLEQLRLEEKRRLEQLRLNEEIRIQKRIDEERRIQKRFEEERKEKLRMKEQRLEQLRLEEERRTQKRIEEERREKLRMEEQRLEQLRLEEERRTQKRIEEERREKLRMEEQRLEQLRLDKERRERERMEEQKRQLDLRREKDYKRKEEERRSSLPPLPPLVHKSPKQLRLNEPLEIQIKPEEYRGKTISCYVKEDCSYVLLEALSSVYFKNGSLRHFVAYIEKKFGDKVVTLTPAEEEAFIKFYNLPTKKLKHNKVLSLVDFDPLFDNLAEFMDKVSRRKRPLSSSNHSQPKKMCK